MGHPSRTRAINAAPLMPGPGTRPPTSAPATAGGSAEDRPVATASTAVSRPPVLVAANARAEGDGAALRIGRPEPGSPVERILTVSGIDRALPFVDDVGDAG